MRIPSNKIKDIRRFMKMELGEIYDIRTIDIFAEILLESYAGILRTEVYMNSETTVNESVLLKINTAVKKLKKEMPIEYIVGYTYFLDFKLSVNPHVLIPRPETEELIGHVKQILNVSKSYKILDAATGSGSIAIALKKYHPQSEIFAFDCSEDALEVAKNNSKELNLSVEFYLDNLLDYSHEYTLPLLDAIVSNPPYVRESEKAFMKKNVLDYEPIQALFVPDNNPLIFYKALADLGKKYLKNRALIICEINEALAKETAMIFERKGYRDIGIIKDMNSKERFIQAIK